ncbi:MAG: xylulokinase [Sphaerochaetaceae bacterium]|nr:xylulokinase [Sphaerochaetaceae bacterium]
MAIIAGIDCGTQSTKVLCFDSKTKKVVALQSFKHTLISKEDGTREQEASLFTDAIKECFKNIPSSIKEKIEGIGVSGQQHGFVALDKNGNPLVPVKLWCDTSTHEQCITLTERLGGKKKVFDLIGNQILPGYTASKVLYLKEKNKERYDKLAHILLPHDYINYYLTGNYVMEEGDASGTAFFDVRNREWSKEVLNAIDEDRDLRECLPKIIKCTEKAGNISESTAKELGLKTSCIVSCGGGDNMMGAIGTGCTEDGSLVMSLGTSGTLFGYSEKCITDEKERLAAFISSSGGYLPLLCTMNCTVASEQMRDLFKKDVKEFDKMANDAPIGCEGVTLLPYFNGERTPNYPNGKATIIGLNTSNTTETNISRAALESAIYSMKVGLEAFVEQGFVAKKLILIGGGAKSKVWCQMISDAFDLEVVIPEITESAAFGGCLQVLSLIEKKKINDTAKEYCRMSEENHYYADHKNNIKYEESYRTYRKYDAALSTIFATKEQK